MSISYEYIYIDLNDYKQLLNTHVQKHINTTTHLSSKIKIEFEIKPPQPKEDPQIILQPIAYAKIQSLVNKYNHEVAWRGTVTKRKNKFIIHDIYVYPQTATAATVEDNDEEYVEWLYNLPDNVFNNLKVQGHSHVNMGVSPSGVDLNMYQDMSNQIQDYMIFMIANKKGDFWFSIYDVANNLKINSVPYSLGLEGWLKESDKVIDTVQAVYQYKPLQRDKYPNYVNWGGYKWD